MVRKKRSKDYSLTNTVLFVGRLADGQHKPQLSLLLFQELEIEGNPSLRWKHSSSLAGVEIPLVPYAKFHSTITQNLGEMGNSIESYQMQSIYFPRVSAKQKETW